MRRSQPSMGCRPGPRPSSPATPAVSGVRAHPSPRYHPGGAITYQSISFGLAPPTSGGSPLRPAILPGRLARRSSARSLRSGSATNQTGRRPPPFQYLTASSHSRLGGEGRRPSSGGPPGAIHCERPAKVERRAAVHRQHRGRRGIRRGRRTSHVGEQPEGRRGRRRVAGECRLASHEERRREHDDRRDAQPVGTKESLARSRNPHSPTTAR